MQHDDTSAAAIRDLEASALFDPDWYLQSNPEARESDLSPAEHYLSVGGPEGRSPSPEFDAAAYLQDHPDVAAAGYVPLLHYLHHGCREGRRVRMADPAGGTVVASEPVAPYYGPRLGALVREVSGRRHADAAQIPEYETIGRDFDVAYYLLRYKDMARSQRQDVVHHYIRAGAQEGRDPAPEFSTRAYLSRYPELAESGENPFLHWITQGRAEGRIAAPFREFDALSKIIGRPAPEVQELLNATQRALRARLEQGELGRMVAKAAALDPLVAQSWPELVQVKVPPFHSDPVIARVAALYRLQEAAEFRRARFVILVNRPRWGGGRRMEGHIGHALARIAAPGEVVVLTTEHSGEMPPDKFPDGVRHVDFAALATGLPEAAQQRVLAEFLRSLCPEAAFNINSRLMWDSMKPYGRALSSSMKLFAGLFCNEQTPLGFWTGYPINRFYRYFDLLDGVCTDSRALERDLTERYAVPPEQRPALTVLEAPVDPSIPLAEAPQAKTGRRPQVFWSGRFDRQKRLDIAYAVARAMPEIDLRMWGEPVMSGAVLPPKPDNVRHEGLYGSFSDLPLEEADLWLYTAEWDGVPSVLLEVAMSGLPLVGSRVGGTGEVLRDRLSEPVDEIEDVEAYVAGIRRVLQDPAAARARARRLRQALAEVRTGAHYVSRLKGILGYEPPHLAAQRAAAIEKARPAGNDGAATRPAERVDLSLILTVHDETVVSGPTMTSADIAVARAREAGFSVEQILALDNATPATQAYFDQPAFDHWRRVPLAQGDLGRARNTVLEQAAGDHIAFLDADDLFSENWLAEGMALMRRSEDEGARVIVHPELNWQFDAGSSIFYNTAQDHPLFTPWFLTAMHYYDSLCLAPRAAHEAIRYVSRDIPNGLSFQDWQFTVETMEAGWRHVVAPETIIFKRRRDNSLVVESSSRKSVLRALDCMAIDRIGTLGAAG
ncbi:glycosyltransferase [Pseudoroseicyclus aestuarii]|uniref:Glycosyltransferase involved in cell wall biosynthesis n=1 Tax=Pseudoroseicyclus aestuarii TaxID=1795041 RepID=A0A318SMX0_9RHOB|nr:glycosyltransferase [Pseudoroseicyclus aestuarii]PYE82174.1 glycosyltransferase involved in cell wall biosynthesis [Pseudoroseicyclus aestuarii]